MLDVSSVHDRDVAGSATKLGGNQDAPGVWQMDWLRSPSDDRAHGRVV